MELGELRMDATGVKIEQNCLEEESKMVFLSNLVNEWPWNKNASKNLSDKEIFTHRIPPVEISQDWVLPVPPCLPGYAYVGIRVNVFASPAGKAVYPRFVYGTNRFPILGHPWDIVHCTYGDWAPLSYPLVSRVFKQPSKPVNLHITHETACFGQVELLAQRFDDLLEEDSQISYSYYDPIQKRATFLHTASDVYRQDVIGERVDPAAMRRVKTLKPIQTLFATETSERDDNIYQFGYRFKE